MRAALEPIFLLCLLARLLGAANVVLRKNDHHGPRHTLRWLSVDQLYCLLYGMVRIMDERRNLISVSRWVSLFDGKTTASVPPKYQLVHRLFSPLHQDTVENWKAEKIQYHRKSRL